MAEPLDSRVEEILQGGNPPLLSRIEKLLKEGGAGGGVSPEQIAAAVEAYLNEHGVTVTETDPTVPEWAKAEQKPSYTATEVGALPSNTYIPPDAVWCGEWNSSRQYNIGDFVSYNGTIYRCEIPGIDIYPDEEQGWTEWFNASTLNALTQHQDISGKLDKAQGAANAGKFMVVGSDGNITAVAMAAWQGGSY